MSEEDFKMLSERYGLAPSRTLREYVEEIIRTETTIHSHSPGCWSWGPRHYMCAYREIERLNDELGKLRGASS